MIKNLLNKIEVNIKTFNNNSLELRYILTFGVFYSHFFAIYGVQEPSLFWGTHSLGWYAVNLFFLLSGVLVTQSYYSNNFISYAINRVFRIMPAYIMALIVSVIAVILFDKVTLDLSLLSQSIRSIFLWLLPITNIGPVITGAWGESSIPSSLNGSLWTISFEVICYFIILPLLLVNKLIFRIILSFIFIYFLYRLGAMENGIRIDLVRVINYFIIGVGMYKFIVEKKINLILVFSLIVFLIIEKSFIEISVNIFIIFLTIFFTFYLTKITKVNSDYSYGIYLYAWPISQIINSYLPGNGGGFYLKIILAYFVLLILSFISWHFIEKKVLSLKVNYKNMRINYGK